ncbi:carbohydrate ABC transporter permease [Mycoplasma simbae]|uniref:carbohydrate ABC transporter permease n=1 Tax=Mycoplasma simbae TaxID=36744 RepID=UPI000497BC13|nr:sugar ABC transporter permease [Mycoplasma simbae]
MQIKINKQKILTFTQILLLVMPLLLCILIFTLIPIYNTFEKSLKFHPYESNKTIYQINLGNYNNILHDPSFKSAILNTTITLFLGTGVSMILALIFAIAVEHLIAKRARSAFLSLIYSQFFISSFAVGIAFTLFFGSKGVFFRLIGAPTYGFTANENRLPIWLYYSLFQVWRSLPFNLVLFASAINRGKMKYSKLAINDNLNTWQRFRFIYLNEISKVFFAILFTNFIFASLLLPEAILEPTYNIDVEKAHTLTSYTIKFMGGGNYGVVTKYEKGYAAAFFSFIYLVFLLIVVLALRPSFIRKMYKKIKNFATKIKIRKDLKHEL